MQSISSTMVGVIIGVMALVLFIFFVSNSKLDAESLQQDSQCRNSVKLVSAVGIDTTGTGIEIKCPTIFTDSDATSQDVVFAQLADALAITWGEFWEGTQPVFSTAKGNYCVIRRVITFKEPKQFSGFADYLLQHDPATKKQSYYSYLTGIPDENKPAIPQIDSINAIDTTTPYAAVFVMAKKESPSWTQKIVPGFLLSSTIPSSWYSAMLLVPYTSESLKNLDCTQLPVAVVNR